MVVKPAMRDQTAEHLARIPAIDRTGAHLLVAIGTNAIFIGDECPAMRAHSARIHPEPL